MKAKQVPIGTIVLPKKTFDNFEPYPAKVVGYSCHGDEVIILEVVEFEGVFYYNVNDLKVVE